MTTDIHFYELSTAYALIGLGLLLLLAGVVYLIAWKLDKRRRK